MENTNSNNLQISPPSTYSIQKNHFHFEESSQLIESKQPPAETSSSASMLFSNNTVVGYSHSSTTTSNDNQDPNPETATTANSTSHASIPLQHPGHLNNNNNHHAITTTSAQQQNQFSLANHHNHSKIINSSSSHQDKHQSESSASSSASVSPPIQVGSGPLVNTVGNDVRNVMLYGIPIVSLLMDGQERLCLAQISNTLLKNFSYNEIHNRRVALGITCVQCTPVQLELLRRAGAMPVSSRRCGMITKREAERLCKSFLAETEPPKLPESFSFDVYHCCAWGCRGSFTPSRYNSSRAKCIKCSYCALFFSPNKFIFHSHRLPTSKYIQPDAANFNSWRRHIKLVGNPDEPSDHIIYAWEDVKAMFNGGSRKRAMTSTLHSFTKNQEHHNHHHNHHSHSTNTNTSRSSIGKDQTKREPTTSRTSSKQSKNSKNKLHNNNNDDKDSIPLKSIDDSHLDDKQEDIDDEDEDIECDVDSLDDDYRAVQSILSNSNDNFTNQQYQYSNTSKTSGHHVHTLIDNSAKNFPSESVSLAVDNASSSAAESSSSSSLNDIVDNNRNGLIKNFLFDGYPNTSCFNNNNNNNNSAQFDRQTPFGFTNKTFKPIIQPSALATSSSTAIAAAIFSSVATAKGSPSSSSSSSSSSSASSVSALSSSSSLLVANKKIPQQQPPPLSTAMASSPPSSSRLTSPTLSHSSASSPPPTHQVQPSKALINNDINKSLVFDYDHHHHPHHPHHLHHHHHSASKLIQDKMNQRWLQNLNHSSPSTTNDSIYNYNLNESSSRINDNRCRMPPIVTNTSTISSSDSSLFSSSSGLNRSAESIITMSNPAILSSLLSTNNNNTTRDSCPAFGSYVPPSSIRSTNVDNPNSNLITPSDNLAEIMWKACMASNVRATLPYANLFWPSLPPPPPPVSALPTSSSSVPTSSRTFMDRDSSPDSTQIMEENGALSKQRPIINRQSNNPTIMPEIFPSFLPNLIGQNSRLFPPSTQQCCPQSPNYLGRMINEFNGGQSSNQTNSMLRFVTTPRQPLPSKAEQFNLMTNNTIPSSLTTFESFKNRLTEDVFLFNRNIDPVNTFRTPFHSFKQTDFMIDHRNSQDLYAKHYEEENNATKNQSNNQTTTNKRKSTTQENDSTKKNGKKNKRSFLAISTLVSDNDRSGLIDLSRNVKPTANVKENDRKMKENESNNDDDDDNQESQEKIVPIDFSANGDNNNIAEIINNSMDKQHIELTTE